MATIDHTPHPRYEVHSITGYNMGGEANGSKQSTTYWVLDRWYNVEVDLLEVDYRGWGRPRRAASQRLTHGKLTAQRTCAYYNREHDAWLGAEAA